MIYTVEIPKALRTCSGLPERPNGTYTQREVATFIAKLDNARKDCKTKLEALVNLVDRQNANAVRAKKEK